MENNWKNYRQSQKTSAPVRGKNKGVGSWERKEREKSMHPGGINSADYIHSGLCGLRQGESNSAF